MAIFNFPPNPTPGQTYPVGNRIYIWDGNSWIIGPSPTSFTSGTGQTLVLTSTTNAIGLNTGGTLTVIGGASIGGDLYLGGSLIGISTGTGGGAGTVNAGTGTFTRVFVNGGFQSTGTNSGALQVLGGVGISGNLWIGGILYSGGAPVLTTASFSSTLQDGQDIDITDIGGGVLQLDNISTLQSVTGRGNISSNQIRITNATVSTGTTTGALIVSGGVGVGGRLNSESLKIADAVYDSTVQTVNSTVLTVIDEFSFNQFRSAKYMVQVSEGNSSTHRCQITELLALVSNTGTVILTEYATINTEEDLGNFDALVTDTGDDIVVRLYFLATDSIQKTVKVLRTAIAR